MTVGAIVWCTITVTVNILGVNDNGYSTVAEGAVLNARGEDLVVDFSDYAKNHHYIGDYSRIHLKDYECT